MSDWDDWKWRRAPKKPPPEHGIKIGKAGTTWWGEKWIEALVSVLGGAAGRLERGKTYARAGRTHDLEVKPGRVTALVTGSAPEPYEVTLSLEPFDDATWARAIAAMAGQARFSAELLAGQMPKVIDEAFAAGERSLFPRTSRELRADCSCPDQADLCKHIAATHYVLGEALDRDPFLLFELRGRTKVQVLEGLRGARGAGAPEEKAPEIPSVKLGKVTAAAYDAPRSALPSIQFSFDAPASHGAVLKQLGELAAWKGDEDPAEVLEPVVKKAAERARQIALAEPEATQEKKATKKKKA